MFSNLSHVTTSSQARPFPVAGDTDARLSLTTYADAQGDEVASYDLHAGAPLSEDEAYAMGGQVARVALAQGLCITDDARSFERLYSAAFGAAYVARVAFYRQRGY